MSALPESVCFRVTRFCNASCGFCLAPNNGQHPSAEVLTERLDWLLQNGVRVIHFCGGEPTIHPGMADLVDHVQLQGGKTRLTTNGIVLPQKLLAALRRNRTHVKVSLHGDREFHDGIVGRRDAFDSAIRNLRRLLDAGVRTSVQTTVVSGGEWVVDWAVRFCYDEGIGSLNILPFIPRGAGFERRAEFALSPDARRRLHERVREQRKTWSGRLDIKWLDFHADAVPVMDADGRIVFEGANERADGALIVLIG